MYWAALAVCHANEANLRRPVGWLGRLPVELECGKYWNLVCVLTTDSTLSRVVELATGDRVKNGAMR